MFTRHGWSVRYSFALLFLFPIFASAQTSSTERQMAKGTAIVDFHTNIQPIFDANCVVCHQTGGAPGGLILEDGGSYRATVLHTSTESKLLLIDPGKPERSYLFRKLEGSHVQAGGAGERMPPTGPLDNESINLLREWILEGAKER